MVSQSDSEPFDEEDGDGSFGSLEFDEDDDMEGDSSDGESGDTSDEDYA